MKLLWIKAGGLVPPDVGGKIRSYNILKQLARKHAVTLFTFYAAHEGDVHNQLAGLFEQVVCVPLQLPTPQSLDEYVFYLRNLLSPLPYSVAKYCRPEVAHRLRELQGAHHFHVLVCDFLTPAPVVPWEAPCPKVLFTHNVEAQIWERHYQVARNPIWRAVCWREYRAMERLERQYLQRADHVLAVSEKDRESFARFHDPDEITVIPTGVDLEYFQPTPQAEELHALVFTGSMDWLANQDAVSHFVKEILPRIRQSIPDATFWVVGRKPPPQLEALGGSNNGVRVTGTVDDIRPYLARGAVFVVPLRVGSGTRLKIFEAMAMGKAIVSTSVGAEGLPVTNGVNILLADDPKDFADKVIRLLKDQSLREALGQAARQFVQANYSWASAAERFDAVLTRLTSVHPALAGT